MRDVCKFSRSGWDEQDLTQLAVKILCDDSTVCDEGDGNFATEADTMIDTVHVYEDDLAVLNNYYN